MLVENERRLAEIWPGCWGQTQHFGLYPVGQQMVVVSPRGSSVPQAEEVSARWLPESLRGRLFVTKVRPGKEAPFEVDWQLGSLRLPAVSIAPPFGKYRGNSADFPWLNDTISSMVMFVVHEAFHGCQVQSLKVPYARTTFLDLRDTIWQSDSFRNSLAAERNALVAAVSATNDTLMWESIRRYRTLQRLRQATLSPSIRVFENIQERAEGVADWVGLSAVAIAYSHDPAQLRRHIASNLTAAAFDLAGNEYQGFNFFRFPHLYAVGSAKAWLLERMHAPEWRTRIGQGAYLNDLLDAQDPRGGSASPP